jgi:universal stress protein E
MNRWRQIVAAVDFSDASAEALREADRMCRWNGSDLTVVHAIDCRLIEGLSDRLPVNEREMMEETERRLDGFVRNVIKADNGRCRLSVETGHPLHLLMKAVAGDLADLLVMGANGSDTSADHMGVIASRCVRKAPVDVLLLREQRRGNPFCKVVACVDFSRHSERAVEHAARIAANDGAELHLLHVCQSIGLFQESLYAKRQEGRLEALAEAVLPGHVVKAHATVHSNPSQGVVDFLCRERADLAVLGTRGRTELRSMLMGTTAEKVISRSPCSVLSVKAHDDDFTD